MDEEPQVNPLMRDLPEDAGGTEGAPPAPHRGGGQGHGHPRRDGQPARWAETRGRLPAGLTGRAWLGIEEVEVEDEVVPKLAEQRPD